MRTWGFLATEFFKGYCLIERKEKQKKKRGRREKGRGIKEEKKKGSTKEIQELFFISLHLPRQTMNIHRYLKSHVDLLKRKYDGESIF